MINETEMTDHYCKKHKYYLLEQDCPNCEEGYSYHDCGEDCCSCLDPENNVECGWCDGKGFARWCPKSTEQNPCTWTDWKIDTIDYDEAVKKGLLF